MIPNTNKRVASPFFPFFSFCSFFEFFLTDFAFIEKQKTLAIARAVKNYFSKLIIKIISFNAHDKQFYS
jgi:hypothetical protein